MRPFFPTTLLTKLYVCVSGEGVGIILTCGKHLLGCINLPRGEVCAGNNSLRQPLVTCLYKDINVSGHVCVNSLLLRACTKTSMSVVMYV